MTRWLRTLPSLKLFKGQMMAKTVLVSDIRSNGSDRSRRRVTMTRTVVAAMASAALMFSLAGLYTGVLAREFIATHVDQSLLRTPPNLVLVFIGYLGLALLMSMLYRRVVRVTRSPAWSGLRFGVGAAVCWLMPYSLVLFGVYRFPYIALPLDFAWAIAEQGIGGVVIGLVHGKFDSKV